MNILFYSELRMKTKSTGSLKSVLPLRTLYSNQTFHRVFILSIHILSVFTIRYGSHSIRACFVAVMYDKLKFEVEI